MPEFLLIYFYKGIYIFNAFFLSVQELPSWSAVEKCIWRGHTEKLEAVAAGRARVHV